ncbi:MAG TPA: J domain-containing protein [Blastocatellia bacterium]|nr:J domain-containing protein [Blastocatellia bacterium]
MSDCWTVLGIAPTNDLEKIRRAYRDLVKQYHPDTVAAPEKKRRYTIICARVNQAYKEACERASRPPEFHAGEFPQPAASAEARARYSPPPLIFGGGSLFAKMVKSGIAVGAILFCFVALEIASVFAGYVGGVPEAVQVALSLFALLFLAVVVYGLLFAGALDLLVIWLFPRELLGRVGLARFEEKLIWLAVVALNAFVFFFSDVISPPVGRNASVAAVDGFFRAAAAGTMPMLLAVNWLRNQVQYRRAKAILRELPEQ